MSANIVKTGCLAVFQIFLTLEIVVKVQKKKKKQCDCHFVLIAHDLKIHCLFISIKISNR